MPRVEKTQEVQGKAHQKCNKIAKCKYILPSDFASFPHSLSNDPSHYDDINERPLAPPKITPL